MLLWIVSHHRRFQQRPIVHRVDSPFTAFSSHVEPVMVRLASCGRSGQRKFGVGCAGVGQLRDSLSGVDEGGGVKSEEGVAQTSTGTGLTRLGFGRTSVPVAAFEAKCGV